MSFLECFTIVAIPKCIRAWIKTTTNINRNVLLCVLWFYTLSLWNLSQNWIANRTMFDLSKIVWSSFKTSENANIFFRVNCMFYCRAQEVFVASQISIHSKKYFIKFFMSFQLQTSRCPSQSNLVIFHIASVLQQLFGGFCLSFPLQKFSLIHSTEWITAFVTWATKP